MRVLLVEDNRAVAESTRRLLELEGFRVDCAFDGEAALALARSRSYDAILLDRRLPKLSGDQVLEHLHDDGDSTPVLMWTGYPDVDSAFEAGRLRAARYLTKSMVRGAELAAAIRGAARPIALPAKKLTLFSAYSGKSSQSFVDLVSQLASAETNPTDLIRALARTILARDLTFVEFLAAAKSFHLLHSKARLPFSAVLPTILEWLKDASATRPLDSQLEDVLGCVEAAGKDWSKFSEANLPANRRGDGGTISEVFVDPTGPTFLQCRRAVVMRRGVLQLMSPHEHVGQVAYRLGYSEHGNFDHDFYTFFGVTPKQFRQLQ